MHFEIALWEIDSEFLHGYPPHKELAIIKPNVIEEKSNDIKVEKKAPVKEQVIEQEVGPETPNK